MNFAEYARLTKEALDNIDYVSIERLYQCVLRNTYKGIYVLGNGGSAAIANHWVCDASKGISEDTNINCRVISLCSNTPLMTAISNDIGYEYVFTKQLEYLRPTGGLVIAISSSGNSKNVCNILKKAKEMGLNTVALTGFTGGEASKLADVSVHIESNNYGIVEDCHMMILHSISQRIRSLYSTRGASLIL